MKLVSLTLSGNNESIIADALKSAVDYCDAMILIDTGITDNTIEVARSIAGEKLVVKKYKWINNFSDARNFALRCAAEENADWAMMLDTDERMVPNGEDFRQLLENSSKMERSPGVIMVHVIDKSYCKERFFKVPVVEEYQGPTHETFPGYKVGALITTQGRFTELAKTPEQYEHKFRRDYDILKEHTKQNPNDPRWFYYLGDTCKNLGNLREAIDAYEACFKLNGWDEESAWSCFRAAECHIALKEIQKALESCAKGLARHPALPELYWLAGWCEYNLGKFHKAEYWAKIAIAVGFHEGFGSKVPRIGFRLPLGQYDGPYDVLKWALTKQNKPIPEDLERQLEASRAKRISG